MRALALSVLFLGCCLTFATRSHAQACTPEWQPGDLIPDVDGRVEALLSWDPDGAGPAVAVLVAGGRFKVGNMADTCLAVWDGATWSALGSVPVGYVTALTTWNGELLAAFTSGLGTPTILRWDGTSWQTFATFTGSEIRAFAVFQGELFAGGQFTAVGSVPANGIARWNGASWSACGSGVTGNSGPAVNAFAVFNNVLYVGGQFQQAGGLTSFNLAVWNGSAWAAQPNFNATVRTLAARIGTTITNSFLFAGGDFTLIGGTSGVVVQRIARFSPATATWTAMGTSEACYSLFVRATGLSTYEVLAGTTNTTTSSAVRRWDAAAAQWVTQVSFPDVWPLYVLRYHAGQYVIGGQSPSAVRRGTGGNWEAVTGPGVDTEVEAVLDTGVDLVIGGSFGVRRGAPQAWTSLGTSFNGPVTGLAKLPNGDLVAAGSFTLASGTPANRIARWNGAAWLPLGAGLDGAVDAMCVLANGDVLVGGAFQAAGGVAASHVARWNGSAWSAVGGGVDGPVRAVIELANGDVVVGGDFLHAGSFTNNTPRIARWNGSAWSAIGSGTGFDAPVLSLSREDGGALVAAGSFFIVSGVAVHGVARWNGSAWAGVGAPVASGVASVVALPGGGYAVRYSQVVSRVPGNQLVGILDGPSRAMVLAGDGDLLVAGAFDTVENVASVGIARWATPCPASVQTLGSGCSGPNGVTTLVAENLPWAGGTFRTSGAGLPSPAFVFSLRSVATIGPLPLASVLPMALPGCMLAVPPDLLDVQVLAVGSTVTSAVALPATTAIAGLALHEQLVAVQVDGALAFVAATSSNTVRAVIGAM